MSSKKIIFITGTDTGVGKTLFASFLLYHLRKLPGRTLAMKPFCSGSLGDVRLLQTLQRGELADSEMNPFYFEEPVAPAVDSSGKKIKLKDVLKSIERVQKNCDRLIIEGAGGFFVPLGENYTVADLIGELRCQVIVVARNQLGTINHTLLTVKALREIGKTSKEIKIVLMNGKTQDHSVKTNRRIISKWVKGSRVFEFPYLDNMKFSAKKMEIKYQKVKKLLNNVME